MGHQRGIIRKIAASATAAGWAFRFAARRIRRFIGKQPGSNRPRQAIGIVVSSFDKGGLEQVVLNLYRSYNALGYKTYLLVQNNRVGELARYLDQPQDMRIFLGNGNDLLSFCWRKNITVLHYHYNTFHLRRDRFYGLKTIYTIHNTYTWLPPEDFIAHAKRVAMADRIIAVSEFVRGYFCKRSGIPDRRVSVIPNGVSVGELESTATMTKESLGLSKGHFTFVNVASFHQVKHHAIMIGAMEQVLKTHPNARLLFVGNIGDPANHRNVLSLLESSTAREAIQHVPYLPREQIGSLFRDVADCMLLPSIQEGCSNAVLEALCCQLPMILTDVGNAREVLTESGSGILIPPAFDDITAVTPEVIAMLSRTPVTPNLEDLIAAMRAMIDDHSRYRALAREAAAGCVEKYGVQAMGQAYLGQIRALMDD